MAEQDHKQLLTNSWLLLGGNHCGADQWLSRTTKGGSLTSWLLVGGTHCGADQWLNRASNSGSLTAGCLQTGPIVAPAAGRAGGIAWSWCGNEAQRCLCAKGRTPLCSVTGLWMSPHTEAGGKSCFYFTNHPTHVEHSEILFCEPMESTLHVCESGPFGLRGPMVRSWKGFASRFSPSSLLQWLSSQFSSVTQSSPTLCDPMNCSTLGLPVHHQLLEFTQTDVHHVANLHP